VTQAWRFPKNERYRQIGLRACSKNDAMDLKMPHVHNKANCLEATDSRQDTFSLNKYIDQLTNSIDAGMYISHALFAFAAVLARWRA
jgi:hypothetical protein